MQKEFPIGFWCGPPEKFTTEEQYLKIKEAGFSIVLPPCEGRMGLDLNRKILSLCQKVGLKAILADPRMPLSVKDKPEALKGLQGVVADYRKHPALMGYFVTDEPGAKQFEGLASVVSALKQLDPAHSALINLFPNYASNDRVTTPSQLNTNTYEDYLEQYLNTVRPDVLSYDHYHFLKDADRSGFLSNLASAQKAAAGAGVPFWNIILSVAHGPYRALNENELRFEAMQSLAYGVKGLIYFTYWLPNDDATWQWSHAIMARDGKEGPLYQPVKRVNEEIRQFSNYLYGAQCIDTFQTGSIPADGSKVTQTNLVRATGVGDLTVGIFRDGKGYLYVFVTNRDYRTNVQTELRLLAGDKVLEMLDVKGQKMVPISKKRDSDGLVSVKLDLPAAGAVLLRWQ
jgi:hypothetical protein